MTSLSAVLRIQSPSAWSLGKIWMHQGKIEPHCQCFNILILGLPAVHVYISEARFCNHFRIKHTTYLYIHFTLILGSLMMVFFIPNQNRLALMKGREIGESELWFIITLLWLKIITCELKIYCVYTESIARVSIAAAKSLQSCPTLCNPIDGSPPGSSVPGIFSIDQRKM